MPINQKISWTFFLELMMIDLSISLMRIFHIRLTFKYYSLSVSFSRDCSISLNNTKELILIIQYQPQMRAYHISNNKNEFSFFLQQTVTVIGQLFFIKILLMNHINFNNKLQFSLSVRAKMNQIKKALKSFSSALQTQTFVNSEAVIHICGHNQIWKFININYYFYSNGIDDF